MTLSEGRLVKVEFEVRLPVDATPDQVEDWICLSLGFGSVDDDNPLSGHNVEPFTGRVMLDDTGMIGRYEEFDIEVNSNGTRSYKVRHIRTPA